MNCFNDTSKDSLDEWVYFLKNSEIKSDFKAKGLAEAREVLKEINLSGEELREYNYFLQNLSQDASYAATYRFELQLAEEKGMEKNKHQVAISLKEQKVAPEIIANATGYSLADIEKL